MISARSRLFVLSVTLLGTLAAASAASPAMAAHSSAQPKFDPGNFSGHLVDNQWFPLKPGRTLVYKGTKDGMQGSDIFRVTHRTRSVGGVQATAVDDTTVLAGRVSEHTIDWYAQDNDGNVWYLGEQTAEFDTHGNVTSTEGTWQTGVDGALPGIFMPADPQVGDTFRQEFYPGHAEDHFQITNMNASVTVPYASFNGAIRTKEWTPLEPGTRDAKFYVKGIGEVAEIAVQGPTEAFRLVQVIE